MDPKLREAVENLCREVLELVETARVAMGESNGDGGEYDIHEEVRPCMEAVAAVRKLM